MNRCWEHSSESIIFSAYTGALKELSVTSMSHGCPSEALQKSHKSPPRAIEEPPGLRAKEPKSRVREVTLKTERVGIVELLFSFLEAVFEGCLGK